MPCLANNTSHDWESQLSVLTSVCTFCFFCTSASKKFKNFHHGDRFSWLNYGKHFMRNGSILKQSLGVCGLRLLDLCACVWVCVCACKCMCVGEHRLDLTNLYLCICKWVGYHPLPVLAPHRRPSPEERGALKVEKLHKGRPHAAKPLIYSGHSLPLIIIAERKTEEDMTEYGVSSEKRVHTGVSSCCGLCNIIVTCIHSTETRLNMEFCTSATEQILENKNSGTFDGGTTVYDVMWPV